MALVRCVLVLVLVGGGCTADASRPPPTPTTTTEAVSFGPAGEALIAFHSDPAGSDDTYGMAPNATRSLVVVDVSGTTPGRPVELLTGAGPSWSPDGERIAFVSERDGDQDIVVMAADGSAEMPRTSS